MKPFDLKKLPERCVGPIARLEGMVSTYQIETRAFNGEERAPYSKISDEIRSIDATLDAAEQGQALSQVERRAAAVEKIHAREELENRALECYVRDIVPELETQEAADMTIGDDGAVTPTNIANKIIGIVEEISPLYRRATYYNVGGGPITPSYDESTQEITMAYAAEFTALTSTPGKLTSISLSGFLADMLTEMSVSLVSSPKFDIVFYAIRKMAEVVAEWIENELVNGTASKIEGLSKVTASVITAAATVVTADELIDLQENIPDALQANCIWVMSQAIRRAIRELKDADGNYLLNKDLTAEWGYSLLGRDVCVPQGMPDMAASKWAVLYLDPADLAVKASETPGIQVLREKLADEHAVGVTCWTEINSKVENKQKVVVLVMGAGT